MEINVNDNGYLLTFFCFALLETLLCSGITYGWTSIVYVFKAKLFYMDLCVDWFPEQNESTSKTIRNGVLENYTIVGGGVLYVGNGKLPGCPAQDTRLNLIFTVSLFCLCGVKFPAGVFIDRCGPRIARTVGGLMYIGACLGLAFVSRGYEDFLFPIFAFICMGGSLSVLGVFQVSNIVFRASRSRVICMLHGGFDSSAVVLLVFKIVYDQGMEFGHILFVYTIICGFLMIFGTFVMIPRLSTLYKWIEEEKRLQMYTVCRRERGLSIAGPDFAVNSLGWRNYSFVSYIPIDEEQYHEKDLLKSHEKADETSMLLHKESRSKGRVLNSVFSLLYFFELIFLIGFQLKLWYFVGTLADFLGRLTLNDKATVSKYIDIFGYIQFGGIFVTPIIGFVFDKDSFGEKGFIMNLSENEARLKGLKKCITPFVLTTIIGIIFCVTSTIERLDAQIVSFVLYTIVRGFLYSNHGAYIGAAFPPSQFGTLYGLGIFIGGTFGVLQYVLFKITSGPLHGDPFWVNIFLTGLVALASVHPFYLWWYCRRERREIEIQR